jgi:hypothetical protein
VNTDSSRDPVLDSLSVLPRVDVSTVRASRLRRRCHAALSQQTERCLVTHTPSVWRRWLAPIGAGAWSALYVLETLRRALSFYRAS